MISTARLNDGKGATAEMLDVVVSSSKWKFDSDLAMICIRAI